MVLSVMGLLLLWSSVPTRNKKLHKESLVRRAVIKTIKLGDRLERDLGGEGCCRSGPVQASELGAVSWDQPKGKTC